MTHVRNLILACQISDIIYLCWSIVLAELPEAEVEVLLLILRLVWVESLMPSAVLTDPVVTKPHVIA